MYPLSLHDERHLDLVALPRVRDAGRDREHRVDEERRLARYARAFEDRGGPEASGGQHHEVGGDEPVERLRPRHHAGRPPILDHDLGHRAPGHQPGAAPNGFVEVRAAVPLPPIGAAEHAAAAVPTPFRVAHLRQDDRVQAEVVERAEQASRRGMPPALVRGRDRDLAGDVVELGVEVESEGAQVPVHADPVPGRHRGRPARPDPIDEEHVRRPAETDRRVDKAHQPGVHEQPAPAQPFDRSPFQRGTLELPAGLHHGHVERALELPGDGGTAGAAAHDDRPLPHVDAPSHEIRATHCGLPSVIRSEKASRPPLVSPAIRPASSADMTRHIWGE